MAFVSHLPELVRQSDVSVGVLFFLIYFFFIINTSIPSTVSHPVSLDPSFHSTMSRSCHRIFCHVTFSLFLAGSYFPASCAQCLRNKQSKGRKNCKLRASCDLHYSYKHLVVLLLSLLQAHVSLCLPHL